METDLKRRPLVPTFSDIDGWYETTLGRAYLEEARFCLRRLLPAQTGQQILEIGAGSGRHTQYLLDQGFSVTAVEPSKIQCERLSNIRTTNRLTIVHSTIEDCQTEQLFDGIVSCNALEFVKDRTQVFSKIGSLLKPSGWAIVGVCNRRSIWGWAQSIRRITQKNDYTVGNFFTKSELEVLFADSDMQVDEWQFGVYFPPLNSRLLIKATQMITTPLCAVTHVGAGCMMCRANKCR